MDRGEAIYNMGHSYLKGGGVQEDFEKAAMQGRIEGRYQLGIYEGKEGSHTVR